ncbi:MAG TPA: hypothetical protein VHO01_16505 [Jatrophihabitans sp.]|nr:hypothetical protein [Jatrophihabitans sp.]
MISALITSATTIIIGILGVATVGLRARSRKEISELLEMRAELPSADQAKVDKIIAWRIKHLARLTYQPPYFRLFAFASIATAGASFALETLALHYAQLANRVTQSFDFPSLDALTRRFQTLLSDPRQADSAPLRQTEQQLADAIHLSSSQTALARHYLAIGDSLRWSGLALAMIGVGATIVTTAKYVGWRKDLRAAS